jgi:hypothetical protein
MHTFQNEYATINNGPLNTPEDYQSILFLIIIKRSYVLFLTSEFDGSRCSTSHLGSFTPRESAQIPIGYWAEWAPVLV